VLKLMIATQPPAAIEALLRDVARVAETRPKLDLRGRIAPEVAAREILHGKRLRVFTSDRARELWGLVDEGVRARRVGDLVPRLKDREITVGEVLARSPKDAAVVLDGERNFAELRRRLKPTIDKIAAELPALGEEAAPEALSKRFLELRAKLDGDALKAYAAALEEFRPNTAGGAYLKRLAPMTEVLDAEGFGKVADALFAPAAGRGGRRGRRRG